MFAKLEKMLEGKKKLSALKFDKELQAEADQTGVDYATLRAKNEIETNKVVSSLIYELGNAINNLDMDVRIKICQWLNSWIYYVSAEKDFDPAKLMTYKRGDIVHVNFGFNVHNELGGTHYAVVIENDNPSSNGTVTVVPLKSADSEEEALKEIHEKTEVYLGQGIIDLGTGKEKYTIAKVNQIRAIDKMRILRPRNSKKDTVYPLDSEVRKRVLDKIDGKMVELYTKETIKRH